MKARQSDIVGAINEMEVDFAILTPSIAGLIEPTDVPTLKTLAVGGEALPQDRIQRWADTVSLIQTYGPAEVGICHTNIMSMKTRPETIGYPLSNSSCWLVDPEDSDRLVPIGAVGELVVGGPSLARGFAHNEARTRDSFIHEPTWAEDLKLTFSRFYKTGDLLRYNLASFDGSFDFVGRKDHQIKLCGQRIEPVEVEHHLGQLPGVEMSMVALPESGCHAGKLVAVVQMRNKEPFKPCDRYSRLSCSPELSIGMVRESLSRSLSQST
jgi:non-ribosomal peptide synthetase component F